MYTNSTRVAMAYYVLGPYRSVKINPFFVCHSYIKESGSVADPRTTLVSVGLLGCTQFYSLYRVLDLGL